MDLDKSKPKEVLLDSTQHTEYRSILGNINWLQSRTQFAACYEFSRCAAKQAQPTIDDARRLNKLVRFIRNGVVVNQKAQHLRLIFWPIVLEGLGILGYPDAAFHDN